MELCSYSAIASVICSSTELSLSLLMGASRLLILNFSSGGKVLHCASQQVLAHPHLYNLLGCGLWGRQAEEGWPLAVPTGYPGV